jgi:hypothetical protein
MSRRPFARLLAPVAVVTGLSLHTLASRAGESAAPADWSAPVAGCADEAGGQTCVSRLLFNDDNAHDIGLRLKPASKVKGFPETCIPRRYLELWDAEARAESEIECKLPKGALAPIGRYFACLPGAHATSTCERPNLGVALEGGGSKSAPFALGTLAGLESSGLLPRVDIISSASGGSYAAYFLFARLLDRHMAQTTDSKATAAARSNWFKDCTPSVYAELFSMSSAKPNFCHEQLGDLVHTQKFQAASPFLYQVRTGQDLLAAQQTLALRGGSWYSPDWLGAEINIAWLTAQHAVTLPFHYLSHGLFNWPVSFSPSRYAYRSGIERAYGHSKESWEAALKQEDRPPRGLPAQVDSPQPSGGSRFERNWQLEDLREAYLDHRSRCDPSNGACDFPLWIMSTTSTAGRNLLSWLSVPPRDHQRFSFELSPVGHGSGLLGFLNRPPHGMRLRDAVGTSAAFLDYEQRSLGDSWYGRFGINAVVFGANGDWGTKIENFNAGDMKRGLYLFTPWPLYGLSWFQGINAPYVHLTDGGNSDNLGIFSQLRRGVKNIVVSTSTDDADGSFPSLCKLKNELELEKKAEDDASVYTLIAPSLANLDLVCNQSLGEADEKTWGEAAVRKLQCTRVDPTQPACSQATLDESTRFKGYNLWFWKLPVVEGCVIRRSDQTPSKLDTCRLARQENREVSRLFIIKPAIWLPNVAKQMQVEPQGWKIAGCIDESIPGASSLVGRNSAIPQLPAGMDIPCQSLAFLHFNWLAQKKDNLLPAFPQDNFIVQTLNSSYTLFGAYFDLGRHYAAQIKESGGQIDFPHHTNNVMDAYKFKNNAMTRFEESF